MVVIYFLIWIILNGRLTAETAITGAAASAAVYWFSIKFLKLHRSSNVGILKLFYRGFIYTFLLIWETVKANIEITKIVLAKKIHIEPQILYFTTKLKSEVLRVILANSITLTPGTLTVALSGDKYCIHCLTKAMAAGVEFSEFERLLMKFENEENELPPDSMKNQSTKKGDELHDS